jgi:predicted tellurium resistance membrane protein TerC
MLIGNNALLVGISLKKLPENKRLKAALIVALIATVFSVGMAISASWAVDNIPYFLVIAGLALVAVGIHTAYANVVELRTTKKVNTINASVSMASAITGALIGNSVASIENAVVIGMLSDGSISLIVAAVAISMTLVAFGSQLFIKLMAKYPRIPFFGGIALALLGVYFTVKAVI